MDSELVVRLLVESEIDEAIKLADLIFRQGKRTSMGVSLPKVFSASLGQAIGCYVHGKLVSFAGMVPSIIRIGAARIKVYSYGAVCTHPEFRGKGYARLILQFAKQHAEQSGAALLLVSGELPLYIEAGCYHFGMAKRYLLLPEHTQSIQSKLSMGLSYREAGSADWFRLHELASAREVAYEQSLWDLADLHHAGAIAAIRQLRHHTYIAEKDGVPVAFCTIAAPDNSGVGIAATSLAIEWAGEAEEVASLLIYVTSHLQLDKLELVIPWHEQQLARYFELAFVEVGKNQGTVYIVDAPRLFQQAIPYWQGLGVSTNEYPKICETDEDKLLLSINTYTSLPLDKEELTSILFGNGSAGITNPLDMKFQPFLPLPMPYTKGLNFI